MAPKLFEMPVSILVEAVAEESLVGNQENGLPMLRSISPSKRMEQMSVECYGWAGKPFCNRWGRMAEKLLQTL